MLFIAHRISELLEIHDRYNKDSETKNVSAARNAIRSTHIKLYRLRTRNMWNSSATRLTHFSYQYFGCSGKNVVCAALYLWSVIKLNTPTIYCIDTNLILCENVMYRRTLKKQSWFQLSRKFVYNKDLLYICFLNQLCEKAEANSNSF